MTTNDKAHEIVKPVHIVTFTSYKAPAILSILVLAGLLLPNGWRLTIPDGCNVCLTLFLQHCGTET